MNCEATTATQSQPIMSAIGTYPANKVFIHILRCINALLYNMYAWSVCAGSNRQKKTTRRWLPDDLSDYQRGVGQPVFAFIKPLRYVGSANYNMSRVYHTNPTMLQIASPKHCEFVPPLGGSTSKKPELSCWINRAIPRTTRQPNWNHVEWGNLVQHTVNTMLERAVTMSKTNNWSVA